MRIFGHTIARMYITVILLLVFLAGASAYLLRQVPYILIFAVAVCCALEMVIKKYYQKQKLMIPFSGIITGLIIGCVAPIVAPLIPVLIACAVAIASKFFIKMKSSNIFNPAAIGLLALGLLSIGSSWWAATSVNIYGVAISLAIVLVIAAYECRRLVLAFSFIIASVILSIATSAHITPVGIGVAFIGVNYLFAFLMLTEPKTSPPKIMAQAIYGVYVAALYFLLVLLLPANLYIGALIIFIALLLGNLTYAIYKKMGGIERLSKFFQNKHVSTT